MNKQKSYTGEFKFKVAPEAIRGDLTIAEIISKYQVPRSVLHKWRKQLLDNGSEVFKAGNKAADNQSSSLVMDKLHATIGRLKVENDFLHKLSAKLKL